MMIATVGLGLSMSGMYGTSVSNAGDLFARYPVCMGFFVLMTSTGAVVAPAVVGAVANASGMRMGYFLPVVCRYCVGFDGTRQCAYGYLRRQRAKKANKQHA